MKPTPQELHAAQELVDLFTGSTRAQLQQRLNAATDIKDLDNLLNVVIKELDNQGYFEV